MIDDQEMERIKDVFYNLGTALYNVLNDFANSLSVLFDSLEPYQKYEILHPRKKPRGSIRRNRKKV